MASCHCWCLKYSFLFMLTQEREIYCKSGGWCGLPSESHSISHHLHPPERVLMLKSRNCILNSSKNNENINLKCRVINLRWSSLAVMEKKIAYKNRISIPLIYLSLSAFDGEQRERRILLDVMWTKVQVQGKNKTKSIVISFHPFKYLIRISPLMVI